MIMKHFQPSVLTLVGIGSFLLEVIARVLQKADEIQFRASTLILTLVFLVLLLHEIVECRQLLTFKPLIIYFAKWSSSCWHRN